MKPVYCHTCGRKLRMMCTYKYDEQTGEKLVDTTSMQCPHDFFHTQHLLIGGEWHKVW